MRKLFIIILSFLFCFIFSKVKASEYITYSQWSLEYPYWLDPMFIESEDRFLWYREVLNSETNEMEIDKTTEYYKELDGYIKIEESKKTFYRYITNERVILDENDNIVYDDNKCSKVFCKVIKLPKKPIEETIENPKTYDDIFVFLIISFFSFIGIVLLSGSRKNDLVLSKWFKNI